MNPQYMQYIILTFKEKQIQIKWNCDIEVTFSGLIYRTIVREMIYCNTISEAAVGTINFQDVQHLCPTSLWWSIMVYILLLWSILGFFLALLDTAQIP